MNDERRDEKSRITRRTFLQRAGAGIAAGAVAGMAPQQLAMAQGSSGDRETDVLVLGSGAAGLAAAIAARQSGANVLVAERAPNPGGSSRRSGGVIYLGGGTPIQRANGFEDSPENMYEYLVRAMGFGADEARIRAYCDGSVDLYEWLVDIGVPFNEKYVADKITITAGDETLYYSGSERSYPYTEHAEPVPRGHKAAAEGSAGQVLMDTLVDYARSQGVEFLFEARAVDLIREGDRIVGAEIARGGAGAPTERILATGGVVVTTGGFQFNQDLVALHCPQYLKTAAPLGAPEEDGDGLTMGQRVGAQVALLERGSPWKFMYPPGEMVKGVLVSPHGTRFITEDIYGGNACDMTVRQHDSVAYLVFDEAVRSVAEEHGGAPEAIAQAETIEELASQIGVPPSALVNTVSYYNDHAAQGDDPLFHKKSDYLQPLDSPPFYAADFSGPSGMVWITLGGLRIDPEGRVVDVEGAPMPGLYAAGRAANALGGIYNSGTSLGDCLFFGRAAGRHASRQVQAQARARRSVAAV